MMVRTRQPKLECTNHAGTPVYQWGITDCPYLPAIIPIHSHIYPYPTHHVNALFGRLPYSCRGDGCVWGECV